jgi:hypothetical protein
MAVCHEDGIFIVKTNRWHSRIASTGKRNFRKQALRRRGFEDEPQDCGTVTPVLVGAQVRGRELLNLVRN